MTNRKSVLLLGAAAGVSLAACGTLQASMTMPNPANVEGTIQATQIYEAGPNKENHRYEARLIGWKPGALRFLLRLVNSDAECADPASFTIVLVDDAGREYPFTPTGAPTRTTTKGVNDAKLTDFSVEGEFPVAVTPATREVTLRIRQKPNAFCRDVDLRWEFTTRTTPPAPASSPAGAPGSLPAR